jgi:hypothetical protein
MSLSAAPQQASFRIGMWTLAPDDLSTSRARDAMCKLMDEK